jgi:hypothetical protein
MKTSNESSIRALRFMLGKISIDDLVHAATAEAGPSIVTLLERHARNEWGDVTDELRARNQLAVPHGRAIRSYYRLMGGEVIAIRTNDERTETLCTLAASDAAGLQ